MPDPHQLPPSVRSTPKNKSNDDELGDRGHLQTAMEPEAAAMTKQHRRNANACPEPRTTTPDPRNTHKNQEDHDPRIKAKIRAHGEVLKGTVRPERNYGKTQQ